MKNKALYNSGTILDILCAIRWIPAWPEWPARIPPTLSGPEFSNRLPAQVVELGESMLVSIGESPDGSIRFLPELEQYACHQGDYLHLFRPPNPSMAAEAK